MLQAFLLRIEALVFCNDTQMSDVLNNKGASVAKTSSLHLISSLSWRAKSGGNGSTIVIKH